MAESIRSLTVKLGYDVDTTGADIFKARFKNLTDSLSSISKSLERSLAPKKLVKIGPLERRIRLLGKRFRRAMRKALRMSPSQFKGLEKDLSFISKKVKAGFDKAKVAALAGAAALSAIAVKSFTGFADVEQARGALRFRVGDENIDKLLVKINKIREETGNVVSELNALNAFNLGADIIGDFKFLEDNFATVIKLSKVLGKDVGEVQQIFANFAATGSNLNELIQFGFFSVEEIEALKKASTDFTQQGLTTRKGLLEGKVREISPRLQENFGVFLTKSQAALDKFSVAGEEAVKVIGKRLNPAIIDLADTYGFALDKLREFIDRVDHDELNKQREQQFIQSGRTVPSGRGSGGGTVGAVTNNNNVSISVNGAGDAEQVADRIMRQKARAVNELNIRNTVPQSTDTTIQTNKQ